MSLIRLVMRNIAGSGFRSTAMFLGAVMVAVFAILSTLVVSGAQASLQENLKRLGADIIIFPWGTRLEELQGGHLMKITTSGWIPRSYLFRILSVPGVEAVSPQLYLSTLTQSPYCAMPEMYIVAFDPATDFVLQPWIETETYRNLGLGKAVAGSQILDPEGTKLAMDDYPLQIVDYLSPTGTDLDQTLFVSFETAQDMARSLRTRTQATLKIVPQGVTTVLVQVKRSSDPFAVTALISERVPGVIPIENAGMFQTQRDQIIGLLTTMLGLMGIIWLLSMIFVGLVFTMTVNARRREIGVLSAIGFSQQFIQRSLVLEGALLGLGGGSVGILVSSLGAWFLRDRIVESLHLPFVLPSWGSLLLLALGGLLLAMTSVSLAVLLPAQRIARQEPALTMKE